MKTIHIGLESLKILSDWSGVERVMALLAGALISRGHRVSLIAEAPLKKVASAVPIFGLPERANVLTVDYQTAAGLSTAREDIVAADLDVVVSVDAGPQSITTPWLLASTDIPLVIAEVISPDNLTHERHRPYTHYGMLGLADCVQVLLESYRDHFRPRSEAASSPSATLRPSPNRSVRSMNPAPTRCSRWAGSRTGKSTFRC